MPVLDRPVKQSQHGVTVLLREHIRSRMGEVRPRGRGPSRFGPYGAALLRELAVLLAASARRSVPMDDVAQLLRIESPEMFYRARLPHLLEGRQPYLLWDLRAASFHPPGQPLQLAPSAELSLTQGRRPRRNA